MKELVRQYRRYIAVAMILGAAAAATGCGMSQHQQRQVIATCVDVICDIWAQHHIENGREQAPQVYGVRHP